MLMRYRFAVFFIPLNLITTTTTTIDVSYLYFVVAIGHVGIP